MSLVRIYNDSWHGTMHPQHSHTGHDVETLFEHETEPGPWRNAVAGTGSHALAKRSGFSPPRARPRKGR